MSVQFEQTPFPAAVVVNNQVVKYGHVEECEHVANDEHGDLYVKIDGRYTFRRSYGE